MITCFFNRLRGNTSLVAEFGVTIFKDLATVKLLSLLFKIGLNHVDVLFIRGVIHPGVFND